MHVWLEFVDTIRAALFGLAHLTNGSTGGAILLLSVLLRLGFLPLSVKVAVRNFESANKLRALEPQLQRIRERHKADPARLWSETQALQKQHNIPVMSRLAMFSAMVQMPFSIGVYRVVASNVSRATKFLWIADIAKPDVFVTAIAASIAALSALLMPATRNSPNTGIAITTALFTVWFVWKLSAGVGFYSIGSSAVGVAQALIVRRIIRTRERAKLDLTLTPIKPS